MCTISMNSNFFYFVYPSKSCLNCFIVLELFVANLKSYFGCSTYILLLFTLVFFLLFSLCLFEYTLWIFLSFQPWPVPQLGAHVLIFLIFCFFLASSSQYTGGAYEARGVAQVASYPPPPIAPAYGWVDCIILYKI